MAKCGCIVIADCMPLSVIILAMPVLLGKEAPYWICHDNVIMLLFSNAIDIDYEYMKDKLYEFGKISS